MHIAPKFDLFHQVFGLCDLENSEDDLKKLFVISFHKFSNNFMKFE